MARKKKVADPRAGSANGGASAYSVEETRGGYADDGYGDLYIEDEHTGVNRQSLRKSRRYLIIGFIGLAIAVIAFIMNLVLYQSGVTSHQNACWNNELKAEQLAQQYVTTNGFTSLPAYLEDIPGFTDMNLTCPDGGTYTWNPVTGEYYCSEHEHHPDSFGQAQSIQLGTQTTTVSNGNASS